MATLAPTPRLLGREGELQALGDVVAGRAHLGGSPGSVGTGLDQPVGDRPTSAR